MPLITVVITLIVVGVLLSARQYLHTDGAAH